MKTLNELYTEITASEELKAEFLTLKTPEDIVAFAKKYGCDITADEFRTFLEEKRFPNGELSEDELEQVAGGGFWQWATELFVSVIKRVIYC